MPTPANLAGSDLPNATQWAGIVTANADLRTKVWSELVRRDAREKNVFKMFLGGEGSGKPFCEKRDLKAGGSDQVVFTTVAPVRGTGILGENLLQGSEDQLNFGTFGVQVDLLRHAVSFTQVMKLLRFTGKTIDQISAEVMSGWYGRKEQDDLQMVLRETARPKAGGISTGDTNIIRVGGAASRDEITLADTLDTDTIEQSKQMLTSKGCEYIGVDTDIAGSEVPQYLVMGPDYFTKGLRRSSAFLQQLRDAGVRGTDKNELFTGKLPLWDNNLIFSHQVKVDTADGPQGSPFAPVAYLGTALASNAATEITGGGSRNTAGTGRAGYFAYFPGYNWQIVNGDTALSETAGNVYYAIIYNITTDRKYELISYTATNTADGYRITGVTRELDEVGFTQNTQIAAADRDSAVHPSGSLIIPCNRIGVPIGYAAHCGSSALYFARGAIDMEQIYHYDDYMNAKNQAHLTGVGVQTVRGMTAYKDTIGRFPNFQLIEGAITYPGVDLVDLS